MFAFLSRVYSNSVCPSVSLPVCPLRFGILWTRLKLTYHGFFTSRLPDHSGYYSSFMSISQLREIPTGSPPAGALNTAIFDQ